MWHCRALLLLGVIVMGCGDSTAPRTVTGSWTGSVIVSAALFVIDADLVDTGGTITGSGSIMGSGVDCPMTVTGMRSGSAVDLTLACTSYTPFTLAADLSKDGRTLIGTLNGGGFTDTALSLSREN